MSAPIYPYSVRRAIEEAKRASPVIAQKECLWCHAPFTSGFGVFCSRACADAEVRS